MNTLQIIWSVLTVPNEILTKIISIPLFYLDAYIGMLFFTSILNIDVTKKQKIIYVLLYASIGNILNFVIPTSYTVFINIIVWPIIIFFVLKTTIIKSLLAEIITLLITSTLELLFANAFFAYFCLFLLHFVCFACHLLSLLLL